VSTKDKHVSIAKGKVFSLNRSTTKGTAKAAVAEIKLIENFGVEGDAHGGPGDRQVSLLAIESIRKQMACPKVKEKNIALSPGDFAENITAEGIPLAQLQINNIMTIGKNVILKISKIGKECHKYCAIYYKTGDCIMPREGIFAEVIKGGVIKVGDQIEVSND